MDFNADTAITCCMCKRVWIVNPELDPNLKILGVYRTMADARAAYNYHMIHVHKDTPVASVSVKRGGDQLKNPTVPNFKPVVTTQEQRMEFEAMSFDELQHIFEFDMMKPEYTKFDRLAIMRIVCFTVFYYNFI